MIKEKVTNKVYLITYLKFWFKGVFITSSFLFGLVFLISFCFWQIPNFDFSMVDLNGLRLSSIIYSLFIAVLTHIKYK